MGWVVWVGVVWAQVAGLELEVPAEVRAGIELAEVTEGTVAMPEGRLVAQAAIVEREGDGDGEGWIRVNGKVRTLREAKGALWLFAELKRTEAGPSSFSEVPIVLFADAGTGWRRVQWFLQLCADPDVRMPKIHLAVRTAEGAAALPVFLPTDVRLVKTREGGREERRNDLEVTLKRTASEDVTRFVVGDRAFGRGDEGFAAWRKEVRKLAGEDRGRIWVVNGWPEVPLSDVVRAVAALRAAGAGEIRFVGTAMPPSGDSPAAPLEPAEPWPSEPVWDLPEKVTEKLDLPAAKHGVAKPEEDEAPWLEVAVTEPDHLFHANGRRLDLEQLRDTLSDLSSGRRDREARPMLSLVRVLVHADRDVRWRELEWVLQACADRRVLANRVHFAVRDGEEERVLPVWLPTAEPPEGVAWLKVDLEAADGGTTVKLRGEALGAGEKGFTALAATLRSIREKYPDTTIAAQVVPAGAVPYGDVVRAVDALRGVGVEEVRFLRP